MKHNKKAFTLVELLVVVLIIGILSAIAIPMYQGAVDKSHWSTMLPASKAIKDAEEAFKMTNGEYSDTMEHLDVQISNADLTFTLNTPNNMSEPNVIKVTNIKLDNVRLASYLDDSPMFAGQLHCEAKNEGSTPNARGQRLCEKLLNGQELNTEGGYTRYLLDQSITKEICGDANLVWSNKNTKCFKTEKDRCEANGMPYNGFCGYNSTNGVTVDEGGKCKFAYYGDGSNRCTNTTVKEGGICEANIGWEGTCEDSDFEPGSSCMVTAGSGGDHGCNNSRFNGATCVADIAASGCQNGEYTNGSECKGKGISCRYSSFDNSTCIANSNYSCDYSTFDNNSTCIGNGNTSCSGITLNSGSVCEAKNYYTCIGTFNDGSKCIANTPGTYTVCVGTYNGSACCEGAYCPTSAPKC